MRKPSGKPEGFFFVAWAWQSCNPGLTAGQSPPDNYPTYSFPSGPGTIIPYPAGGFYSCEAPEPSSHTRPGAFIVARTRNHNPEPRAGFFHSLLLKQHNCRTYPTARGKLPPLINLYQQLLPGVCARAEVCNV
jgi:hypothetical protein